MRHLLPKIFLGFRHTATQDLGRGIKKYTYEQGRAILYEPHPSVRKFIPQYLLYTKEGYKYLLCRTDAAVRSISYTLTMLDRKGRVLDVLVVKENSHSLPPRPLLLHADTSYVALSIREANGLAIRASRPFTRSVFRLIGYAIFNFLATLGTSILLTYLMARMLSAFEVGLYLDGHIETCLLTALLVTVLSLLMLLRQDKKKGIGITRHGKS
jgi:hypothetical protein